MARGWTTSRQLFLHKITLSKITRTLDDSYFGSHSETSASYDIKGNIQHTSTTDEVFMSFGGLTVGDAIGFFKPSYRFGKSDITVEANDKVVYDGNTWRVDRTKDHYDIKGDKVYRETVLRKEMA